MRDLELLLEGARKLDVPLLIGTAGGAGAEPHVQETHELIVEVAREKGFHFSLATIYSDLTKDYLHERIKAGETGPLDGAQSLTHEAIEKCDRIVGVMGIEPYVAALSQGAEVVIAGRSSDTAIFAAPPLMAGRGVAPAWHSGKILECGASSAVPMAPSDCMLAWVEDGAFEVEPASPTSPALRSAWRLTLCTKTRALIFFASHQEARHAGCPLHSYRPTEGAS